MICMYVRLLELESHTEKTKLVTVDSSSIRGGGDKHSNFKGKKRQGG